MRAWDLESEGRCVWVLQAHEEAIEVHSHPPRASTPLLSIAFTESGKDIANQLGAVTSQIVLLMLIFSLFLTDH